ncbi:MAG: glutamate racemase, partial [Bacteroidetes bacterium]|nr:glutamate racemase [Bacteroidota bacterium]
IAIALPTEDIIYFGDTAHLPYGDKSKDLIRQFTLQITDFLLNEKGCKCIVIACNTASAAAYEFLRDAYKGVVPIFNVIDPIIEAVVADNAIKEVGIIATKTTIDSGVYQEKLTRRKPELPYSYLATPLLAPMIEEGFFDDTITHAVVHNYLENEELKNIDALILGCTHYVIIRKEIDSFFKGKVKLFDSTDIVAQKLKSILEIEGLLNNDANAGEHLFFVSDFTESFQKTTRIFFGEQIKLEQRNLGKL